MKEPRLVAFKAFCVDILDLIKFKILFFSLLTVIIAALVAVDQYDTFFYVRLSLLLIGSTFVFSSAAALNHALEVNTDLLMPRTKNRPLAAKRFDFLTVIMLSIISAIIGFIILYIYVNSLVFFISFFILISYDFFLHSIKKGIMDKYTCWSFSRSYACTLWLVCLSL